VDTMKLIVEVSDALLPNRLSAGIPATDGRSSAIWTHDRRELAREFEPTAQSIFKPSQENAKPNLLGCDVKWFP
jgi:hypothetical protein